MRKLTGILFSMVLMGVLAGCYNTSCDQPAPPAPVNMKGEG